MNKKITENLAMERVREVTVRIWARKEYKDKTHLLRSAMLVANALVMKDPPALELRCPNVSIQLLHLNLIWVLVF